VRKSWDVDIFLFWVWDVCLGVLLGFDDDGDDGEREERKKRKKRGGLCEWTRSCLGRCLVLVRDGQGIL
jgi:hypothetical protein